MEELDTLNKGTNERVTKLTNDLSEINDKLEEMKESFESKDSGLNDTSPLVRVKAALQNIKSEINAFDLRLGKQPYIAWLSSSSITYEYPTPS